MLKWQLLNIEHDLFESDLQASRFRHQYLEERDEHISVQEIEVSVPTCKRRISDDLSEEDSNPLSLVRKPWEQVRLIMKRNRRKSKN